MICQHKLRACTMDFSKEIAHHSGDETIEYKRVNGDSLYIALYHPEEYNRKEKYPLMVFIHGGGWESRKIFDDQKQWAGDHLGFLARHYADRGYLCASIDYRMMRKGGHENGYELIDLVDDCADAVSFLKEHAEEMKIDLDKTAVLGESAGGYLAAALVTLPWLDRAFFKSAIIVNGITDLTDPRWGARLNEGTLHPRLQGLSVAEQRVKMSPVCNIDANTRKTLLIHGAADRVVFPFHSLKFYDLLLACGQKTDLHFIEDTDHAFLLAEYMQEKGAPLDALEISVRVIDEWLK